MQPNPPNPIVSISSESEGQRSESRTYAVSKTVRHTIDPPGRIQKIAAAVLVDDLIEEKKDAKGQMHETPAQAHSGGDQTDRWPCPRGRGIRCRARRRDLGRKRSLPDRALRGVLPIPITERVRMVTEKWIWLARYLVLPFLFAVIYLRYCAR